jgi:hypothetical protein
MEPILIIEKRKLPNKWECLTITKCKITKNIYIDFEDFIFDRHSKIKDDFTITANEFRFYGYSPLLIPPDDTDKALSICECIQSALNNAPEFEDLRKGLVWVEVWDTEKEIWNLPKPNAEFVELISAENKFKTKEAQVAGGYKLEWVAPTDRISHVYTFPMNRNDKWRYPQKELKPIDPHSDKWVFIPNVPELEEK